MEKGTTKQRIAEIQSQVQPIKRPLSKMSRIGVYFPTGMGIKIALVLWGVYSVMYISVDQFLKFRYTLVTQAYQGARQELLNNFIAEATKKNCDTVTVGDTTNQVTVINVACLMPPAMTLPPATASSTAEKSR